MPQCPECGKIYDVSWKVCLVCKDRVLVPDGSNPIISAAYLRQIAEPSWRDVWLGLLVSLVLIVSLFIKPMPDRPPVWMIGVIYLASVMGCFVVGSAIFLNIKNPISAMRGTLFLSIAFHLIALSVSMFKTTGGGMWLPIAAVTVNAYVFPVSYGVVIAVSKLAKNKKGNIALGITREAIITSYIKSFLVLWVVLFIALLFMGPFNPANIKYEAEIEAAYQARLKSKGSNLLLTT